MPLTQCLLNLDRNKRELSPHGTPDFQCEGYDELYDKTTEMEFPWHWHEEIELIVIESGTMTVQIPGKLFEMHEGDSVFINSGIMHYGRTKKSCRLHSIVFSHRLVSGYDDSAIDRKYVRPLIQYASLDGCLFTKRGPDAELTKCIVNAFDYIRTNEVCYEIGVRENLSQLFMLLYKKYEAEIKTSVEIQDLQSQRVRKMMTFITEHFAETITLTQIAQSAAVSERECLRCFKRAIQISPIQYLITYRLHQSAVMLIQDRTADIADVAMNCGFASPGSFTQLFRRSYQCTPREYRCKR